MNTDLKKLITEALSDQSSLFGDELLTPLKVDIPVEKVAESAPVFNFFNKEKTKLPESEFNENWTSASSLEQLDKMINSCKKCALGEARNKFVFGVGNPKADILVIGEGPGADEDAKGEPFVGRAGKLLDDILDAIDFSRKKDVYIANIVKCRPPNNRNPLPAEVKECFPYLMKQIEIIQPKMILCLGLVAANNLLENKMSLTKMRGQFFDWNNIKVMVTYHPAALLRNPNWKRGCWEDVKLFRKYYDENVAGKV
ncbi:MAG: uracil-DNA glycosylase [Melioribacteraceae bacterium]|nr:MAG: uracil-DNA glycosylase [Melioribacteraceae bacterium]